MSKVLGPAVTSKPTITREVTIHPTVGEIAQSFCDLSGEEQASFFHEVARVFMSWNGGLGRDSQILEIARYMNLNPNGTGADWIRILHDDVLGESG